MCKDKEKEEKEKKQADLVNKEFREAVIDFLDEIKRLREDSISCYLDDNNRKIFNIFNNALSQETDYIQDSLIDIIEFFATIPDDDEMHFDIDDDIKLGVFFVRCFYDFIRAIKNLDKAEPVIS